MKGQYQTRSEDERIISKLCCCWLRKLCQDPKPLWLPFLFLLSLLSQAMLFKNSFLFGFSIVNSVLNPCYFPPIKKASFFVLSISIESIYPFLSSTSPFLLCVPKYTTSETTSISFRFFLLFFSESLQEWSKPDATSPQSYLLLSCSHALLLYFILCSALCFVLFGFVYLSHLLLSGSFLLLIMLALPTHKYFSALCQLMKKAQVFISLEGSSPWVFKVVKYYKSLRRDVFAMW